jgi:hypothetical protein
MVQRMNTPKVKASQKKSARCVVKSLISVGFGCAPNPLVSMAIRKLLALRSSGNISGVVSGRYIICLIVFIIGAMEYNFGDFF